MFKKIVLISLISVGFLSSNLSADVFVHGYYKSNGTYVHSYHRTAPDDTITNNYSYRGY